MMALSSDGARAGPALPEGPVDRVRRRPARSLRQGGRRAARGCPAGIRAPFRTGRRCGPPNLAFPTDGCPASRAARIGRRRSPVARLERRTPGGSPAAVVFVGFPGARAQQDRLVAAAVEPIAQVFDPAVRRVHRGPSRRGSRRRGAVDVIAHTRRRGVSQSLRYLLAHPSQAASGVPGGVVLASWVGRRVRVLCGRGRCTARHLRRRVGRRGRQRGKASC